MTSLVVTAAPAAARPEPRPVRGPVAVSGPSPVPDCTAGAGPGSVVFPGAEVEPSLAVNPRNPGNIVGFYQQDRWSDGSARALAFSVTRDAGRHWRQIVLPGLAKCAGGTFDRISDPWVSFSPNGEVYANTLATAFLPETGGRDVSAITAQKSADGGLTWSDPIIIRQDADPAFFNDKNSLTADPTDARFAYAVWDRTDAIRGGAPAWFSRTTDGGRTWEPARIIYDPTDRGRATIAHQIAVTPDGTLVNVFTETPADGEDDTTLAAWGRDPEERRAARSRLAQEGETLVRVIRSTDHGRTWSAPITVGTLNVTDIVEPDEREVRLRTADIVPDIAVDSRTGRLYVVWQDAAVRSSGSGVVLSTSANGGRTWSRPLEVGQTPDSEPQGNGQAFTPMVDVARGGAVGVTYYDFRRNTPAPGALTDYWIVTCRGAACTRDAARWRERHVGGSFDVTLAPLTGARGYFLGDYMGLDHAGPVFVPIFAMTRTTPGNQQDMFVAGILP
ncbi:MAG TPA: sialidase family protein [Streptosporangiaceae bacterium]|nr:sialidase family protein [Streptosporangiaceae bacterium]